MTNLTQTTTNINIEPTRLEADHYQVPSFTGTDKTYNQHFDYDLKRWTCDCPNFTMQKNQNCKHIVLLRAYIKLASQQQATASEHHSSSQELISILERISNLEHAQAATDAAFEQQQYQHEIKADQIVLIQDRLRGYDQLQKQLTTLQDRSYAAEADNEELQHELKQQSYTINRQQQQIDRQSDLISALQSSVCKLNELTISQDETIKKLLAALDQQGNFIQAMALQAEMYKHLYEDQAQQIDKLHDQQELADKARCREIDDLRQQLESQARPAEQIVRVVIEQPATRQAHEASPAKEAKEIIKPIKDASGKILSCKVGKFNVPVVGNSAAGCNCSIGIMDRQCPHMMNVDRFLSK